jgi:hypothetical protein
MKPVKYVGSMRKQQPSVILSFSCPVELANKLVSQANTLELSLSQYIRGQLKASVLETKE